MTVTYSAEVANSSLGCFLRLLLRWRGSIYKLLWKEFIVFATAFFTISLIYRFALNDEQKLIFETIAKYCFEYSDLIPISFVLGFYVTIVVSRWSAQFNEIPWPDRMALFVTANVHGQDERGRLMRRTMMRYLCLSFVITMHSISPGVKRRFPTFSHMTQAGFMLPSEQKVIEEIQTPHNKYFVPLAWATSLVSRARKEGRIKDDFAVKTLIDEINAFRGNLGTLFNFDWLSIPLVYTQVVTWAVYTFFLACLMGSQTVATMKGIPVPIFTFLQFFFYMGWLKVAECLVNPFGDDDDDFDINTIIDRNLQVSYLVVDEMHAEHPELIKDQYWDEVDFNLPYTNATESQRQAQTYLGSAMDINLSPKMRQYQFVVPSSVVEISDDDEGIEMRPLRGRYGRQRSSQSKADSPRTGKARVVKPMGITHRFQKQARSIKSDSPRSARNYRQRSRKTSENSVLTSCDLPLPSQTDQTEYMFEMSDLDGEDEPDTPINSTTKLKLPAFFDKISSSFKSRSQKSLVSTKTAKSAHCDNKTEPKSERPMRGDGDGGVSESTNQSREQMLLIDEVPKIQCANKDRKRHASKHSTISHELETETQQALEELRFQQEHSKVDKVPRSISLCGDKAAQELHLDPQSFQTPHGRHHRTRTNSTGPNVSHKASKNMFLS